MERALAVGGKDDRPVAGFGGEAVERRGDVGISEVERLARILAGEQERAERGLAVARRPDVARAAERARLALDEQPGAQFGVARRD